MRFAFRALVLLLLVAGAARAMEQPAIPLPETQPRETEAQPAGSGNREVSESYRVKAEQIRELIAGTLPLAIDPAQLFDIVLEDVEAVALEAARLRALLGEAGAATPSESSQTQSATDVAPQTWTARLDLDRARLEFYSLPASQRTALLVEHARRQTADAESRAATESAAATQRAHEAAAERARVLAQAEAARTEAERLMAEEHARLLGVAASLAEQQAELARASQELAVRAERTLSLHRRVRQTIAAPTAGSGTADALYQELRAWLRASREELAVAMRAQPSEPAVLRNPQDDPLANLAVAVDRRKVDTLLNELLDTAAAFARQSREFQSKHSQQLYEEVQSLNDDRLALLPHLSAQRRAAITGFEAAGVDQAFAELRQVSLVMQFHAHTVATWLRDGEWFRESAGAATSVLLKVLLAIGLFYYGQRVIRQMLRDSRIRLSESARKRRSPDADLAKSAIDLMERVLLPLSSLLLVLAIMWMLPASAAGLMEVQLIFTILQWTLGAWFVVVTLDALAIRHAVRVRRARRADVNALRLRSLRTVGIAAVVAGLLLSMSRIIVGPGTIYAWLLTVSLWAAVPLGLLIIHWWRETIFRRMERVRRTSIVRTWILAHRTGWRGLLAATVGGVMLFVRGSVALLRSWLGSFTVTRRLLAYAFRQQLDRMAERHDSTALAPLPAAAFAALAPNAARAETLPGRDGSRASEIIEHIDRAGGGVFAVVGERGSGRSTVLQRVSESRGAVAMVDCPFEGIDALIAALARVVDVPATQDLDAMAARLDAADRETGILIDNAHRLIQPVMGGLAAFDRLIDCARRHSTHCAWVVSVDSIVWRFYGRARAVDHLFDEIQMLRGWPEEDIAALLESRSRAAGLDPQFDRLLSGQADSLPEEELAELHAHAATSYYRLIWDYAAGNPAVSLHSWRTSLGVSGDGRVHVTPFRIPEQAVFDKLPDSAVFVLRAVLQLERARATEVAKATMVPITEVESALRYGLHNGYLERAGERYAVAWNWYRPATRFLQRRHLLAGET